MENLTLYTPHYRKRRIGKPYDGGYVVCDLPGKYDCLISGGILDDISFEQAFLNIYAQTPCIAFDGTINDLPVPDSRITFVKKNLGNHESETLTNLHNTIGPYTDIFMKIDIEGHEFRLFPVLTEDHMKKVKQLVLEVHTPGDIQLFPNYFQGLSDITHPYLIDLFRKLNTTHTLVHVHPNNACKTHYAENVLLPNVFECTFIRNDFVEYRIPNTTPLPFSIDMPNVPTHPVVSFTGPPFVHASSLNSLPPQDESATLR